MKYSSGASFRMALEERLRTEAFASGLPLSRLRKMVAFERLLARLLHGDPDGWVLKGGMALQSRFAEWARTTKDLDLHTRATAEDAIATLVSSALSDLGDFFSFAVARPPATDRVRVRCAVESRLDGRVFESFHVDLGTGEPQVDDVVSTVVTSLLAFAEIPPVEFPCLPLGRHIAEEVHAIVRTRATGESTRAKDLVDIVLLAETSQIDASELRAALETVFAGEADGLPERLPAAPSRWEPTYRGMARDLALAAATLSDGSALASKLVDPVLGALTEALWCPSEGDRKSR